MGNNQVNRTSLGLAVCLAAAVASFVFLGELRAQASDRQATKFHRPIAVGVLRAGDLVILESRGRLIRMDPKPPSEASVLVQSFGLVRPLDMAVGFSRDRGEIIVISRYVRSSSGDRSRFTVYSPSGYTLLEKVSGELGLFIGVAVDEVNDRIITINSTTGTVFMLEIGEEKFSSALDIHTLGKLGPLALDAGRQTLFGVDILRNRLYATDLGSGETELRASSIGRALGIAFDQNRQKLYFVDTRRLWVLETESDAASPEILVSGAFRRLAGVAIADNGNIWLADTFADRLYCYSPEGELLAELP